MCCCHMSSDFVLCYILLQTFLGSKFSIFLGVKFSSMSLVSLYFVNMTQLNLVGFFELLHELVINFFSTNSNFWVICLNKSISSSLLSVIELPDDAVVGSTLVLAPEWGLLWVTDFAGSLKNCLKQR